MNTAPKTVMKCSSCGAAVHVVNWRPGATAPCRKCGGQLLAEGDATVTLAPADPLIGRTLGGCTISRKIGSGGMGAVYLARHLALDKTVAIKVLPPEVAEAATAKERFQREARAAARLEHPNIVQVLNVGNEAGYNFIVMQFIEGESLGKLASRKRGLPWPEAVRILREAARGLAAAHKAGVVHRDIKPDNILITSAGDVKVADFGLARTVDSNLTLSQTGQIMGTPDYMSPEQAQGQKIDGRSDIYSLGVTLYYLLSAKKPFVADTPVAVILKHVSEPHRPIREFVPDLPDALVHLIDKMLSKNPAHRFQSCEELIEALATIDPTTTPGSAIAVSSPGVTLTPPPRSRRALLVGGGIAGFLLAIVLVAILGSHKKEKTTGLNGSQSEAPLPVEEKDPREAEAATLLEKAAAAIDAKDWPLARRLVADLDAYRDTLVAEENEDRITSLIAQIPEKGLTKDKLRGKVEEMPGGKLRVTYEFENEDEVQDWLIQGLGWSIKRQPMTALVGSTGVLQPRFASGFRDGTIRVRMAYELPGDGKDSKRPFRRPSNSEKRPAVGGESLLPQFGVLLRQQPDKTCYALAFDMSVPDKPRAVIVHVTPNGLVPTVRTLASKSLAALPSTFEWSASAHGDLLQISLEGKVILEVRDTTIAGAGPISLNFRRVNVALDRIQMEGGD